jgi:hypothetical protein
MAVMLAYSRGRTNAAWYRVHVDNAAAFPGPPAGLAPPLGTSDSHLAGRGFLYTLVVQTLPRSVVETQLEYPRQLHYLRRGFVV